MVFKRDKNLITTRMKKIIRKETIIVVHFAAVVVTTLDVLDEPSENLSTTLKIISFILLGFFSLFGLYRLKKLKKDKGNPLLNIILYTLFIAFTILVLADIGSVYVFFAIVPIFLADFYYSRRLTYAIIAFFLLISMLQPILLSIIYATDPGDYLTFRNFSINFVDWMSMAVVARLMISTLDVTNEDRLNSRRLANEATTREKLVSELVDAVDVAVIGITTSGVITFSNAVSNSILDTNKQINGGNLYELFAVLDDQQQPLDLRNVLSHTMKPIELKVLKKYVDGSVSDLELSVKPIVESSSRKINNLVILIRDVTVSNRADEDRKAYISLLSHELRTPVATVEALISNMQFMLQLGKSTAESQASSLQQSHDIIVKLSNILNSVDKFAELQDHEDKIEKVEIDLKVLLAGIDDEFKPKAQEKGLDYKNKVSGSLENITLLSEMSLLSEIVKEIVQNALVYTDDGGIEITVSHDDNHSTLKVTDTGKGIPARQMPNLFKAGFQAEKYETRSTKGMGLGLYISKKIAQRLDIVIDIESDVDRGTTVTLSIPSKVSRTVGSRVSVRKR
jgi:signal transduction histidine kinase